jgi:hypothetical protein
MGKKLTREEFVEKARKVHGDKYDYSKVDYQGSHIKICIICPIHGEFWQTPNDHLRGYGCKLCGISVRSKNKTSTTKKFIKKAKEIHGNKYDYSKVEYVNNKTKVCIVCLEHGEFWQTPKEHLRNKGCPKCNKSYKMDTTEFIRKAKEIHGNKYDYSKVEYVNNKTKVCIVCLEHGEFWQTPNSHLAKHGCPFCNNEDKRNRYLLLQNNIINKFNIVHNYKYDYSKFIYSGINYKSVIICPIHGEFIQSSHSHLKGYGCPRCNQSHLEKEIEHFLTKNNIKFEYQKRFKWLGRQSLDFYLPDYNIAIECQGKQHFEPVEYFGGEKGLIEIKKRDTIKKELCKKNNVKLIYYSNIIYNDDIYINNNDILNIILYEK